MGREIILDGIDAFDLKAWYIKWRSDVFMLKEVYRQLKLKEEV